MTARLLVLLKVSCMKHYEIASIVLGIRAFGDFLILVYIINSKPLWFLLNSMQARTYPSSFQSEPFPKATAKPRARLTENDVINIFSCKQSSMQATTVANMYGMSEKAIRDIWTARTWARETWHLEPSRTLVLKQAGRPRGSTDSRPRQKKQLMHLFKEVSIKQAQAGDQPFADHCEPTTISAANIYYFQAPKIDQQCDSGDTEGSCLQSLDEQLDGWDSGVCVPDNSDPFEDDWARAQSSLPSLI